MQLATYLGFPGHCEEAFNFYERCFAPPKGVALSLQLTNREGSEACASAQASSLRCRS